MDYRQGKVKTADGRAGARPSRSARAPGEARGEVRKESRVAREVLQGGDRLRGEVAHAALRLRARQRRIAVEQVVLVLERKSQVCLLYTSDAADEL